MTVGACYGVRVIELRERAQVTGPGDTSSRGTFACRSYTEGAEFGSFLDRAVDAVAQLDEVKVLIESGAASTDDKVKVMDRNGNTLYDNYVVIQVVRKPRRPDTLVCRK